MSIKKKKRRKKRQPQQIETPEVESKEKAQFQDNFQSSVGNRIEEFGAVFEGKGRNIMYGLAAVAVLVLIAGIFYTWNRRANNSAQLALGNAIETSQAFVTDSPVPAGSTTKTFKTEKERAEAAIKEFQEVAEKHGSPYSEKAEYFIAVNRLYIDRAEGIKALEAIAEGTGENAVMAKFALAQTKSGDGKYEEAAKLYEELSGIDNTVVSKDTVNFELAKLYEKLDKSKEAADLYFNIAKAASEQKDSDDKPVPLSETAREAKEKLEELAPEKAKEIGEQESPPEG